ncbi:MAG: hypothetical protein ACXV5Q_08880 [Frankiaceae bacterium]
MTEDAVQTLIKTQQALSDRLVALTRQLIENNPFLRLGADFDPTRKVLQAMVGVAQLGVGPIGELIERQREFADRMGAWARLQRDFGEQMEAWAAQQHDFADALAATVAPVSDAVNRLAAAVDRGGEDERAKPG